jgi:magnesium-transporting ATPase (P-type)
MAETLPWNLPLPRLLAELGTTRSGLSGEDAARRLAKYGPNDALAHRRRPLWRQLLDRFANPLILILLFASGLSAWTGEVTSFALIVGIILLSVVLDVVQQARAENTVDALRRSVGLKAEVLRDGKIREVAVDALVPGDVVELKAGDIVPGDCRLVAARDLFVNQALLTGEAYPAEKEAGDLPSLVDEPGQAANFLLLVVKGAPEEILARSAEYLGPDGAVLDLDDATREQLLERFEAWGEEGYRVLGVSSRAVQGDAIAASDEDRLTFAGFALFVDPPKRDAADAVHALAKSGVEVKILSGDNERITRHVCTEIGVPIHGVLTGQEVSRLSDDALRARAASVNLFCRVTPQQKQRILLALKRAGRVVGFLGDGINDASALHGADVGISVDNAADVAKEAADLVLLERDLGVVHDGVIEGRRTVENVTKYILMGSSSNFGNMFSMAGAALFLPFLPMLPPQVLLNNLLYDVSEVGVPFDNVDAEALKRPVRWDIGFIERFMLVLGPVSSLFDFLTFFALLSLFGAGEAMFQTGWFIESLATQCLVIFIIRTRGAPWQSRPHPLLTGLTVGAVLVGLLIPLTPLGKLIGFVEPPPGFYVFLVCAVVAYLLLVEIVKRQLYRRLDARSGSVRASAHAHRRRVPRKAA